MSLILMYEINLYVYLRQGAEAVEDVWRQRRLIVKKIDVKCKGSVGRRKKLWGWE